MTKLDPWGAVKIDNYSKLFDEFGISKFDELLDKIPNPHRYMRRHVIFGHRSYESVLDAMLSGKPFAAMSGFMPTGRAHLGHKMVMEEIIWHQQQGGDAFLAIADMEAHSVRGISWQKCREYGINEYILSAIAFGLEPGAHIYFQSKSSQVKDLSFELGIKANFSEMSAIYGFNGETNIAHMVSAVTQSADILHPQLKEFGGPKPVVIPVGPDQDPHIRLTRGLANRMNAVPFSFESKESIFILDISSTRKVKDLKKANTSIGSENLKKSELIESKSHLSAKEDFRNLCKKFYLQPTNERTETDLWILRNKTAEKISILAREMELKDILDFFQSSLAGERVGAAVGIGTHFKISNKPDDNNMVINTLREGLSDPHSRVRYRVVEAIGKNEKLTNYFRDNLNDISINDKNSQVKDKAKEVLKNLEKGEDYQNIIKNLSRYRIDIKQNEIICKVKDSDLIIFENLINNMKIPYKLKFKAKAFRVDTKAIKTADDKYLFNNKLKKYIVESFEEHLICHVEDSIQENQYFEDRIRELNIAISTFYFLPPASTYHKFMTGLQGGKMSSSVPESYIALTDKPEDGGKKVMRAITGGRVTLEEQKVKGGEPDKCSVYELLLYHLVEDDNELLEVYKDCVGGTRVCGSCKKYTAELMREFLKDHQEKRELARGRLAEFGID